MAVESAQDLAAFFDAREFAEAAVYQSPLPGAPPVPCLVIIDRGQGRARFDGGDLHSVGAERHLWVAAGAGAQQVAEVRRDGLFTITADGEVLRVQGLPKLEQTGRVWSAELVIEG